MSSSTPPERGAGLDSVALQKSELRRAARRKSRASGRKHSDPQRLGLTRALHERLLALPELRRARTVSLYAAADDEVPSDPLHQALRARGLRIAFPRIEGEELRLHAVETLAALQPGQRGLREPPAGADAIAVEAVDLFVVPGLLFDRSGRRLGRGGGHFDRLLGAARADAVRVGVCYSDQLVDSLPSAPWDVPMHMVVTDDCVLRPRVPGAGGAALER